MTSPSGDDAVSPALLTAQEAAARLGVKRATLYAYVSRGLLERRLSLDGRTSLFDPGEVDRMRSTRRKPSDGELTAVISSSITRVSEDGHRYRDVPVADLVGHRFESVADLIWERTGTWALDAEVIAQLHRVRDTLAPETPLLDRIRISTAVLSASDPLRNDDSVDAMSRAGRSILLAIVEGLPMLPGTEEPPAEEGLAARLWPRLTQQAATPERVSALNASLILLADHGLAASTFAARVAASVRADPYSVVSTGLGTVAGVLHGFASVAVHDLIRRAADIGPEHAVGEILARGDRVPGVGHRIYKTVDPREPLLLELVEAAYRKDPRVALVHELRTLIRSRLEHPINVDFALGAFSWLAEMGPRGGECIFVARTVGWTAHGIEERGERPVRFRPRARYVGPAPSDLPERRPSPEPRS